MSCMLQYKEIYYKIITKDKQVKITRLNEIIYHVIILTYHIIKKSRFLKTGWCLKL